MKDCDQLPLIRRKKAAQKGVGGAKRGRSELIEVITE